MADLFKLMKELPPMPVNDIEGVFIRSDMTWDTLGEEGDRASPSKFVELMYGAKCYVDENGEPFEMPNLEKVEIFKINRLYRLTILTLARGGADFVDSAPNPEDDEPEQYIPEK